MVLSENIKEAIKNLEKDGIEFMHLRGIENKNWWINSENLSDEAKSKPWGLHLSHEELLEFAKKIGDKKSNQHQP